MYTPTVALPDLDGFGVHSESSLLSALPPPLSCPSTAGSTVLDREGIGEPERAAHKTASNSIVKD